MSFLNNRLAFSADFSSATRKDMLTAGIALPATYGADSPKMNNAPTCAPGLLSLSWRDEFQLLRRPFSYSVTLTFNDYVSEHHQVRQPRPLASPRNTTKACAGGEIWGYRIDGLFASDEEARNYPVDQTTVNEIINASAGAERDCAPAT